MVRAAHLLVQEARDVALVQLALSNPESTPAHWSTLAKYGVLARGDPNVGLGLVVKHVLAGASRVELQGLFANASDIFGDLNRAIAEMQVLHDLIGSTQDQGLLWELDQGLTLLRAAPALQ